MHRKHTRSVDVLVSIHTHTRGKLHYTLPEGQTADRLHARGRFSGRRRSLYNNNILSRRWCPYPPLRPISLPCRSAAVIAFPTPTRSAVDRHDTVIPYGGGVVVARRRRAGRDGAAAVAVYIGVYGGRLAVVVVVVVLPLVVGQTVWSSACVFFVVSVVVRPTRQAASLSRRDRENKKKKYLISLL